MFTVGGNVEAGAGVTSVTTSSDAVVPTSIRISVVEALSVSRNPFGA